MEHIKQAFQGTLFLGLVFLFFSLIMAYLTGQINYLDCARSETGPVHCGMRVTWKDLLTVKNLSIEGLRGADLEQDCDDDGCNYKVILDITTKKLTFGDYGSQYSKANTATNQINQFLQDPSQPSLSMRSGDGSTLILPGIFAVGGLGLIIHNLLRLFRGEPVEEIDS